VLYSVPYITMINCLFFVNAVYDDVTIKSLLKLEVAFS